MSLNGLLPFRLHFRLTIVDDLIKAYNQTSLTSGLNAMKPTNASTVSAYDAKTHFSQLLHEVEEGRAFTINRHGKPVARLVPADFPDTPAPDVEKLLLEFRAIRQKAGENLDIRALVEEGRKY